MLFQQNQNAMTQAFAVVGDRKCSLTVHSLIAIAFLPTPFAIVERQNLITAVFMYLKHICH
ncbi:hypothetical protein [Nostoc sp.]|uniref:hypothetical protein n=1 Tax=Nostoc sp. TaxID=1180 RepID=UPI002FFA5D73